MTIITKQTLLAWKSAGIHITLQCNRCRRPMPGTTAYDGACACGGLIRVRVA